MMHANISRNAPCPCGSGRKYKHCCLVSGTTDTPAGSWTEPPEEDWEEELDSRYRYHPYAIARVVATYATNENKGKLSAKQLKTLADMWNIAKVAAMQTDDILARLRALGIDLGMDSQERMRMQRLGLKSLLSMTEEYLLLSRAQSDKEGRAQQNSMLMNEVIRLLPKAKIPGGVTGSGELLRPRLEHRDAALCLVPALRDHGDPAIGAALRALERMEGTGPALKRMEASFAHRVFSENLEHPLDALLRHIGLDHRAGRGLVGAYPHGCPAPPRTSGDGSRRRPRSRPPGPSHAGVHLSPVGGCHHRWQ